MKTKLHRFCYLFATLALLAALNSQLSTAFAQGTAFTYQGRLNNGTNPANGHYDFIFTVWNASSGGSEIGGTSTSLGVGVTNGLFTVTVDFGSGIFTGPTYWLQITVETNGVGPYVSLSPRQQLLPTPYAIFAESANATGLTGTIPVGELSPDVALLDATQTFTGWNSFSGNISLLDPTKTIVFPATGGANSPMMAMFASGTVNADRMVIAHSLAFPTWGLQYQDASDKFNFLSAGTPVLTVNLGSQSVYTIGNVGIGTTAGAQQFLSVHGGVNIDQANVNGGFIDNGLSTGYGLTFGSGSGEGIASKRTVGGNQFGLDFYTSFTTRMSIYNNGNVSLNGNTLLLEPSTAGSFANDGLVFGDGGLPGINNGYGPWLAGYYGGALGGLAPNVVALSWDAGGDVSVSNNLSVGSLTVRGDYLVVNGGTPLYAYIGDDGNGNDVQIGSQRSGITAVAAYNTADDAYMHFYCSSITIEGGADLAEPFQISKPDQDQAISPGAVVVIDDQNPGQLRLSDHPYDTRVAGVVSGANGISPGIQMQQQGVLEGGKNVALTGRVYVQADTSNGTIKPGDLLTTSSTPGHAMKVSDHVRAAGAILGKAMTGLSEGKGMVLVLVTLQ